MTENPESWQDGNQTEQNSKHRKDDALSSCVRNTVSYAVIYHKTGCTIAYREQIAPKSASAQAAEVFLWHLVAVKAILATVHQYNTL